MLPKALAFDRLAHVRIEERLQDAGHAANAGTLPLQQTDLLKVHAVNRRIDAAFDFFEADLIACVRHSRVCLSTKPTVGAHAERGSDRRATPKLPMEKRAQEGRF